jgi:hypothetical protein
MVIHIRLVTRNTVGSLFLRTVICMLWFVFHGTFYLMGCQMYFSSREVEQQFEFPPSRPKNIAPFFYERILLKLLGL